MEKPRQDKMRHENSHYHHYIAVLFWRLQTQDRDKDYAPGMKTKVLLFPANMKIHKHPVIVNQNNM